MKLLLLLITLITFVISSSISSPQNNENAKRVRIGKRTLPVEGKSEIPYKYKQTTREEILDRKASRSLSAKVKRQSPVLGPTYGFCMNVSPMLDGVSRPYSQFTYATKGMNYGVSLFPTPFFL